MVLNIGFLDLPHQYLLTLPMKHTTSPTTGNVGKPKKSYFQEGYDLPLLGVEPCTSGSVVHNAIHCTTAAADIYIKDTK